MLWHWLLQLFIESVFCDELRVASQFSHRTAHLLLLQRLQPLLLHLLLRLASRLCVLLTQRIEAAKYRCSNNPVVKFSQVLQVLLAYLSSIFGSNNFSARTVLFSWVRKLRGTDCKSSMLFRSDSIHSWKYKNIEHYSKQSCMHMLTLAKIQTFNLDGNLDTGSFLHSFKVFWNISLAAGSFW